MKPSSSTNVSRASPARRLSIFFGIGFAVVLCANLALLRFYQSRRYGSPEGEYTRKVAAARTIGRSITTIFAGDSTVSVGVMPRVLGPTAINLAWSGFEPSELGVLESRILEIAESPRDVFIGLHPNFLSQNEWRNTTDVPLAFAAADALRAIYSDSNSFRPLVMMGGLNALSNRYLSPPFAGGNDRRDGAGRTWSVEADGLLVIHDPVSKNRTAREDFALPYRAANFRMLESFRNRLVSRGVRVSYLVMPYTPRFERMLREGTKARLFIPRYRAEIDRIFGPDVVDLSGSEPESSFRDEIHLTRDGAEALTKRIAEKIGRSAVD